MTTNVEETKRKAREKAERERAERQRALKEGEGKIETEELDQRTVNEVANYGDPKEDPRVGEQNVPPDERVDGYTDGVRHDQMEGVQSASQLNELDKDALIDENLANPPNREVLEDRQFVERAAPDHISPRTKEEMEAGKKALGGRKLEKGSRMAAIDEAERKEYEARRKAFKGSEEDHAKRVAAKNKAAHARTSQDR